MTIVKHVTKSELGEIVKKALNGTRVFSAVNTLVDGSSRRWNIHPKAGRQFIKGTGKPLDESLNMVRVYDMTRATDRDAKGRYGKGSGNAWRTMRLDTLETAKVQGVTYTCI